MYLDKTILELHELLVQKKVTPLDLVLEAIEEAKKDTNNAFETICEKEAIEEAKNIGEVEVDNLFWGIPYVAKDNYSTKDILTTGSSDILKDYIPVFDATVIKKLKEKKAILIGKTTLDELAMGGSGTTGHKGKTYNPYDETHTYMVGGSSCGSASCMASGIVPFALGSDTGDSIRKPASYAGLVGFKPTWGRISRYGLFPFAPSLDHVGYFTRSVEDAAALLTILEGHDDLDMTSSFNNGNDYLKNLNKDIHGVKIAVIKEIVDATHDEIIKKTFNETLNSLKKFGATIKEVSVDKNLLAAIFGTYFVISCSEATSNNANLDGIKFGLRQGNEKTYQEVMMNARTKGFGEFIKRRFVIGSYSLFKENQEELFLRAQKARRRIVNTINNILKEFDAIYVPSVGRVRNPFINNVDRLNEDYLIAENHLAISNFAGLPSLTLPIGLDNKFPFGANIFAKPFEEQKVFNIAYALECELGLKNITAKKVLK